MQGLVLQLRELGYDAVGVPTKQPDCEDHMIEIRGTNFHVSVDPQTNRPHSVVREERGAFYFNDATTLSAIVAILGPAQS